MFQRGKKIDEFSLPQGLDEDIVQIHTYGSWIIGCCATRIEVWNSDSLQHHATLQSPFAGNKGNIITGGLATMPTFTNKVFAGREDGSVEIWNIATAKLIYRIEPTSSDLGPVSALEPTPALSLLAIAYANGPLTIHDVLIDEEILRLNAGTSGQAPITSISFRTDNLGAGPDGQQAGIMATASYSSGDINIWDLNEGGRRVAILRGAHTTTNGADDGISKIEFLPSQAVLVTSGADNALKTWIFDQTPFSPLPRPLHARSGHSAPVSTLSFLPAESDGSEANGKWLFTTSRDQSAWGWSLRRDGQSTELSQGAISKKAKKLGLMSDIDSRRGMGKLKAPEITCQACSLNRDGGMGAMSGNKIIWANAKQLKRKSTATDPNMTGWESIVTGHRGDRYARTWFWGRKKAGRWLLETGDAGEVTSVAVSSCGTFAIVGSANGGIDMFNLQSGLHRQRYPTRLTKAQAQRLDQEKAKQAIVNGEVTEHFARGLGKHTGAVMGVEVDSLNQNVLSCGLDGKLKFWEFATGRLLHELDWSEHTTLLSFRLYRPSGLVAISCGDLVIRVVDIATRRIIRELTSLKASLNDFSFSHDGRWILAVSSDKTLRVWDLPTGYLIDAMRFWSPSTAVSMSPTGEYLATAHEDSVGVDIWTNRTLFKYIPTKPIQEAEIAEVSAPTASGEGGKDVIATALEYEADSADDEADNMDGPLPTLDQLGKDIETLSLVPRARWQNLLHLDMIRERNKPIEPPKAPEKTPFFLPTLQGSKDENLALIPSNEPRTDLSDAGRSRILKMDRDSAQSRLVKALRAGDECGDFGAALDYLKALSPAAADMELHSLATNTEMTWFLHAMTQKLQQKKDYELVQTWMAVFLRIHGDAIGDAADEEEDSSARMIQALKAWREEQKREKTRLDALVGYCVGVIGFLRSAR